ncbi:MAG: GNAT family N-acetyltransferase [Bacteroidota bacterium]
MIPPPFPTPSFALVLSLDDGRAVVARPVAPADRERLRTGFDQLSTRSRQLRFFAPVAQLSEAELRYLTDVDQVHHAAWGLLDPDDATPGIGIGRFVRLPDKPDAAEFSLTVADAWQGTGAGRLLLALLLAHARRVDVRMLCGLVERDNDRVLRWMQRLGASSRASADGLVFRLPTDPDEQLAGSASMADALQAVESAWAMAEAQSSQNEA